MTSKIFSASDARELMGNRSNDFANNLDKAELFVAEKITVAATDFNFKVQIELDTLKDILGCPFPQFAAIITTIERELSHNLYLVNSPFDINYKFLNISWE